MAFRTKKISQMDPKGSNLAPTDLLEISELVSGSYVTKSITGQEIIDSVPPTAVEWGDIGGTLSAQTDLQTALDGKVDENTAITGATKTKITYDSKGLVTAGADATTADISDSLNKRYVTDANLTTLANTSGVNTGDQTLSGLGGVPITRTLTINGTSYDLSADRSWTISTATPTLDAVTIAGNTTTNRITIGGATTNGSVTASGAIARGNYFNNTLVAAANNDVLVGLDINPTFTNGAFTGVTNYSSRIIGGTISGSSIGQIALKYSDSALTGVIALQGGGWGTLGFWGPNRFSSSSTPDLRIGQTGIINTQGTLTVGGSLFINATTDAGFKLDVNGTARVQGKLSVNTPTATSAVMEVTSTTQGFLPPRMTTTQKNAIASPAAGLMVYDTTLNAISYYNGTMWI